MIYTITPNPSLDYEMILERFDSGCVNRALSERTTFGGKGLNGAAALRRTGERVRALGFIGGYVGHEISRLLKAADIDPDFVETEECSRINVKLNRPGIPVTEVNGAGQTVSPREIRRLIKKLDAVRDGDAIVTAGSVPKGIPEDFYGEILAAVSDRRVTTAVDASGVLLQNALPLRPTFIKPNREELGELFGKKPVNTKEVFEAAEKLQARGARNVLVSLGEDGACLLCENGDRLTAEAPKGVAVQTVGAGDACVAGFLHAVLAGADLRRALAFGVASGSIRALTGSFAEKRKLEETAAGVEVRDV